MIRRKRSPLAAPSLPPDAESLPTTAAVDDLPGGLLYYYQVYGADCLGQSVP